MAALSQSPSCCHTVNRGSFQTHFGTPLTVYTPHQVLLLLLLSHFSRVRLCATPSTAAHQAPPSLGFSRQEHWSGCHLLLQCTKVKSESEVAQSCLTPSDPMDCSLPGSSIHRIFQARVLEWGAIAFSSSASRCSEFQSIPLGFRQQNLEIPSFLCGRLWISIRPCHHIKPCNFSA